MFSHAPVPGADKEHTAEKPTPVLLWALGIVPAGAVVLDPFMGSGATLVASKADGLRSIGIDVDERCCEVTARRLAQGSLFDQPARPVETVRVAQLDGFDGLAHDAPTS